MSVTHMSLSLTRIRVQIRFFKVHTMYTRLPIGILIEVGVIVGLGVIRTLGVLK